jgi:hypothetical protein
MVSGMAPILASRCGRMGRARRLPRFVPLSAWCGAHIGREFIAAADADPDAAWCKAFHGLNNAAHQARDAGQAAIPATVAKPLLHQWNHAVLCGLAGNPRRPGREQSKTRNLLERLRDHHDKVLLFAHDLSVPHTNNQAERDLRPAKTQIMISGCHRLEKGARAWLTIRAHISTHLHPAQERHQHPRRYPRQHHRPAMATRPRLTEWLRAPTPAVSPAVTPTQYANISAWMKTVDGATGRAGREHGRPIAAIARSDLVGLYQANQRRCRPSGER